MLCPLQAIPRISSNRQFRKLSVIQECYRRDMRFWQRHYYCSFQSRNSDAVISACLRVHVSRSLGTSRLVACLVFINKLEQDKAKGHPDLNQGPLDLQSRYTTGTPACLTVSA
ncbi:hypothetical protein AVEN_87542-1 [Araneus ventricosus]|uniref:Uncharacterized protein n=1 Tax=Araneus ventricosus TaxID=182803 RepID=A0A4Y2TDT2_ARAVE|nr:hypothetical protein AVEN_87542-1 [Araneus ventricosus]